LKTLVYIADKKPVLALIRGDKTIEETKLMNALGANEIRIASAAEIAELLGTEPGFIGPMDGIRTIADKTVKDMKNFVVGVNQADKHLVGSNLSTINYQLSTFTDIRLAERGDVCINCGTQLFVTKGIEVGNIFKLGTKYSAPMNAVFLDENGKTKPYVMGCYGIGISRTAAAAVEAHHDENGIKWPLAIAPYRVVVVPVNIKDELQMNTAEKIYNELLAKGVEAVLDDRDERAGVKFKDADLIGFPYRITVGKTITDGLVEFKTRAGGQSGPGGQSGTGEVLTITPQEAVSHI
jgi:prolyl-tRNA synthetase